MSTEQTVQFERISPKKIPAFEGLAPGHRACQGCGEMLAMRMVIKALGEDTIVISATGCMEVVTTPYPQTAWNVPWLHVAFENAGAVGSGVEAARKAMLRKGRLPSKKTNIVVIGGDGGTSDIGLQALSGAMERGHDLVYVCLDNEAYMNTGIQRSSATPYGASTTTAPAGKKSIGQVTWKKDMAAITAAHNIPYVATACPSYPFDLMDKVAKGIATQGPAYVHILSICPTGWRCRPELTVEVGRLAVQTGIFPLYEIEDGKYKLSVNITELRPVQDYLKLQGRFGHLSEATIKEIQDRVDSEYSNLMEKVGANTGVS